jgi:iron complex transport system substrate-binding protein
MRIASLVPSATEMCAALELDADLIAVTHECDHPPGVERLPQLTRSVLAENLTPAEIDVAVRQRAAHGEALYELDAEALAELDVDLILAKQVCAVCAVSYEDVVTIASRLSGSPAVLSLDPSTLEDVFDDAVRVAEAAGEPERGVELSRRLRRRVEDVRQRTASTLRPRVAALEWLDPPYIAGHWVPEMIAAAGGEDALARAGQRSRRLDWQEIAAARPDLLVVMPCGLNCAEATLEAEDHRSELAGLGAERCYAVDAAASFSRPGPRLADGVELLAGLIDPDLAAAEEPALASTPIALREPGAAG